MPSAPLNLRVIELNSTAVRVTFVPPASPNGIVTHYLVNYSISDSVAIEEDVSVRIDEVEGRTQYSIVLVNLTEFTSYRIEVTAFTRIGEGNVSVKTVETDPDMASPPTDLVAMAIGSTTVELTWGYPLFPRGEISGYIIDVDGFQVENLTLDTLDDRSDQSFVVGSLRPFTEYRFGVAAYAFHNELAIIGAREEVTVRTLEDGELADKLFICHDNLNATKVNCN